MTGEEPHCCVATIGAGAAGTIATARLLQAAADRGVPLEITLIDPGRSAGRGVAYATSDERHLLNVPAGGMSAVPEDPDGFVRWLSEYDGRWADPRRFVPRHLFGAYLADHLTACAERCPSVRLTRMRDRVIHATRHGGGLELRTASGRHLVVEAAILATGIHPPDTDWAPHALKRSPGFIADPWAPGALDRIADDADVLLVGTGLTMVDAAMSLERRTRTVHAISRNGLLPRVHAAVAPVPGPEGLIGCTGLDELRGLVLRHIARTRRAGGDWRAALDSLRPLTTVVWQRLPESDKARFLRTDARVWEVHRHRMPAETAERIASATAGGRLTVAAAEVAAVEVSAGHGDGHRLRVALSDSRRLTVGAVVNCTGPRSDPRRHGDPLTEALLTQGLAGPGPLGLGLDTDSNGRTSNAPLWTLGANRRGSLWESTAVPEIRTQAVAVAEAVVNAVTAAVPAPGSRRRTTDRYGLRLSTTTEAAAIYNTALEHILRVQSGGTQAIADAVRIDPGFALGHAALALLGHEWGADVDVPTALADAARAAEREADARERSFVAAVTTHITATGPESGSALLRHIEDHPRDALAVSVAVPTIAFGGVTCGEQTWALVERLAPAYGDDWWYQGQLAFVRQEQQRWDEAEALAARALAAEPASGHAVHARTHVFYETGAHAEGLSWLDAWIRGQGPRADNRAHFSWHAALHELMLGDADAVRRRYLGQLAPPTVTGTRVLVDSGALLWRCRVTRLWEGPVPSQEVLASAPDGWLTKPPTAFIALHAAVTLAAAEHLDGLAQLRSHAARHARPEFREVIAPLCTALGRVVDGDWAAALPVLRDLVPRLPCLGGSAAQHAVIEETLLFALTSTGRHTEAAKLLDARLDRRPSPLDSRRLASLRP